jgi:hypothetical protein
MAVLTPAAPLCAAPRPPPCAAPRPPTLCAAPRQRRAGRVRCARRACAASLGNEERNDAGEPPLLQPSAALSARGAVEAQLQALQCNDTPRRDHGCEVAYLFAHGTGGFGLSKYFGFSAGAPRAAEQAAQ